MTMVEAERVQAQPAPAADAPQAGDVEKPGTARRVARSAVLFSGVALAVGLALSLLAALGYASGPVIAALGGAGAVIATGLALWDKLRGDLSTAGRRVRATYLVGVLVLALVLVGLGVLLQPVARLPRLPGSSDIALIGMLAENKSEQNTFDDVTTSLERSLPALPDGTVKSYVGLVHPPLEQLWRPADQQSELNSWVQQFLLDTDAEFVVGGWEDGATADRPVLHVAAYVPFVDSADAPELSGWFVLTDFLLDRNLDGNRARRDLVGAVADELGGLTAFLDGLDAWQNGRAADAVAALGPLIDQSGQDTGGVLRDLARLFRGHAYETRAQLAKASDRARLLDQARHDYLQVETGSPVALRARLSLAVNSYLRSADAGCAGGVQVRRLKEAADELEAVAAAAHDEALVSLKARVNEAQVAYCLSQAGDAQARANLPRLLGPLTGLALQDDDPQTPVKRQVKALALSIDALLLAQASQFAAAVDRLGAAIQLERGRLERRAVWLGLESAWLLRLCRVEQGAEAQEQSLDDLRAAASRSRVPQSEIALYEAAYGKDLERARIRCGTTGGRPR